MRPACAQSVQDSGKSSACLSIVWKFLCHPDSNIAKYPVCPSAIAQHNKIAHDQISDIACQQVLRRMLQLVDILQQQLLCLALGIRCQDFDNSVKCSDQVLFVVFRIEMICTFGNLLRKQNIQRFAFCNTKNCPMCERIITLIHTSKHHPM